MAGQRLVGRCPKEAWSDSTWLASWASFRVSRGWGPSPGVNREITMNRPIHFELNSPDPERAQQFFEQVFGWQFREWSADPPYWIVATNEHDADGEPIDAPGINGGLIKSRDGHARTVNTIEVISLDETLREVQAAGGTVVKSKMPIAGLGYLAFCKDPTGIIFGVVEQDAAVAEPDTDA